MKTFIILGCHRSATSLAAKGLHENGVHMGDNLIGAHESNPWGHFEDREFVNLNERLLHLAGGSWYDPPALDRILDLGRPLGDEIAAYVKKKERELWGWKDPRTVLTIYLFWPYVTNPHIVAVFRNPSDIAKSLVERDKMPYLKALALAREYQRRMMDFLEQIYGEDRFNSNSVCSTCWP